MDISLTRRQPLDFRNAENRVAQPVSLVCHMIFPSTQKPPFTAQRGHGR
jgi:hypothetical protein